MSRKKFKPHYFPSVKQPNGHPIAYLKCQISVDKESVLNIHKHRDHQLRFTVTLTVPEDYNARICLSYKRGVTVFAKGADGRFFQRKHKPPMSLADYLYQNGWPLNERNLSRTSDGHLKINFSFSYNPHIRLKEQPLIELHRALAFRFQCHSLMDYMQKCMDSCYNKWFTHRLETEPKIQENYDMYDFFVLRYYAFKHLSIEKMIWLNQPESYRRHKAKIKAMGPMQASRWRFLSPHDGGEHCIDASWPIQEVANESMSSSDENSSAAERSSTPLPDQLQQLRDNRLNGNSATTASETKRAASVNSLPALSVATNRLSPRRSSGSPKQSADDTLPDLIKAPESLRI